jgi:hypothetical protein
MWISSLRSPFKVLLTVIKREGGISIRSGRRRRVQFVLQYSFLRKGAVQFLLCFWPCQHTVTWLQLQTIMTFDCPERPPNCGLDWLAIGISSIILNIGTPVQFAFSCELDTIYNQQSQSGSVSLLESTISTGI